jgi:hypothetical protein
MAGLPLETRVGAIAIHPQNSQSLLVGVEGHGLYASTDGGMNWQMIAAGLQPNSSIRDILFDPTNPQVVYLSDLMSGVYRSTDGGLMWTQINNGLTTRATTGLSISSDGQHVYVATNGEGAFRLDLNGIPPAGTAVVGPTDEESAPPAMEEGSEDHESQEEVSEAQPATVEPEPPAGETETQGGLCGGSAALPLAVGFVGCVAIILTRRRAR